MERPGRRDFLIGGGVALAMAAAAGVGGWALTQGGQGEGEPNAPPEAPEQTQPDQTDQTDAYEQLPVPDSEVAVAPLNGLAAPYIGLAMGDRFFPDANGNPRDINALMAESAKYGNVVRVDFTGKEDPELHKEIIARAKEHGVGVIGMLGYITDPTAARDYAGQVADEHGPQNGGVLYWVEAGNEPNLDIFWKDPDPAAYAQVLAATTEGVKAVNNDIVVVTAGLSPAVDNPPAGEVPQIAPVTFFGETWRQLPTNIRRKIGGIGWHGYNFTVPNPDTNPDSAIAQLSVQANTNNGQQETLAQVFARTGIPADMPVYLTEFGAPTAVVSEAQQEQIYRWMLTGQIPNIKTAMRLGHTLDDGPADPNTEEGSFGIRNKAAGALMRQLVTAAR